MRNLSKIILLGVALVALTAANAWSFPDFARSTSMSCATCHSNPAGGADLTADGKAFKADHKAKPAKSVPGANFVGSAKCKMCHVKQFNSFATTAHATAFAGLTKDAKASEAMGKALSVAMTGSWDKTETCVSCHVTGFKLAGGYTMAGNEPTMQNVGCEDCHGPGSLHVAAAKDKKKETICKASDAMCTQCHNATTSPKFKHDEYKAKGVHKAE